MAEAFNRSIENLRKKSRTLLARAGEKSKRVDAEVKKLQSQISSFTNGPRRNQGDCILQTTNSWRVRNDSSEMSAVLCPDYSLANTMPTGKVTLTSAKPRELRLDIAPRRPVKECYCNIETKKTQQRSSRTQQHKRKSPCRHCRSHPELGIVRETEDKTALSSPISCETFRRVQRIDYTPRSQFLRNVQNKICELQSGGQGDHLRTCPRSSSYHRLMASTMEKPQNTFPDERTADGYKNLTDKQASSTIIPRVPANSLASEQSDDVACTTAKGVQTPSRTSVKSKLRKTLRSSRRVPNTSEQQPDFQSGRSKRAMQLRKNCPCCCQKDSLQGVSRLNGDTCKGTYDLPGDPEERRSSKRDSTYGVVDDTVDQEVADLRKFREQNYFETHGSSRTLASSSSSGSLQQYLLNERLFPEAVGRIRKRDLVVTIPACATTQKKRVHYFPRYVVRQERSMSNTNYKRKRCQNCPLIGHAIDLGILKAKLPVNSLALKYQTQEP